MCASLRERQQKSSFMSVDPPRTNRRSGPRHRTLRSVSWFKKLPCAKMASNSIRNFFDSFTCGNNRLEARPFYKKFRAFQRRNHLANGCLDQLGSLSDANESALSKAPKVSWQTPTQARAGASFSHKQLTSMSFFTRMLRSRVRTLGTSSINAINFSY